MTQKLKITKDLLFTTNSGSTTGDVIHKSTTNSHLTIQAKNKKDLSLITTNHESDGSGPNYEWTLDTAGNINLPLESAAWQGNGFVKVLNGYPTLLGYGSGMHGGPELDWMNCNNVLDFNNATTIRNSMYLNGDGLYIGINENNVSGINKYSWQFDTDGNLTIPNGGKLGFDLLAGHEYGTITLQSLGGLGTYAAIASPFSSIQVHDSEAKIQVRLEDETIYTWSFGSDGVLTLPNGNGIVGNVTGNLTGDVTGDVTGNVTGDITGKINTLTITSRAATLTLAVDSTLITSGAHDLTLITTANSITTIPSGTHTLAQTDSPTFTGTVSGVSQTMVGLSNVTNESKSTMFASPALTGTPTAPTAASTVNTTQIATTEYVKTAVANLIASAPSTLDTLNELAIALGNDANYASTITTALGLKAPIASPTFTGTVSGISATMVSLGNVTNESKATMFSSPVFTGTTTLNTVAYTWPSANPVTSGYAIVNNASGTLSWANVTPIVTDDVATNSSFYPMFTSATSGNLSATIKTSSSKLYYNPNSGTLTSTIFTASSDERLKENIKPVTNALNKVLALQGVNFNRIGSSELELGLIAQHVEKIIPEVVYTNETGIKSLAYPNLVALLIEAIKEQNTKIEEILRMAK